MNYVPKNIQQENRIEPQNFKWLNIKNLDLRRIKRAWAYTIKTSKLGQFAGSGYKNIVDGVLSKAQFAQANGLFIFKDFYLWQLVKYLCQKNKCKTQNCSNCYRKGDYLYQVIKMLKHGCKIFLEFVRMEQYLYSRHL